MASAQHSKRAVPSSERAPRPAPGPPSGAPVEAGGDLGLRLEIILTVRSDPRYLSVVRGVTQDIAAKLCLSRDAAYAVKLAVGEACANAMEHGSPAGKADRISVTFASDGRNLRVEVSDVGPGICAPRNRRFWRPRMRGYGIILMRSLMDKVDFVETGRGTRVVLIKRLPC